MKRFISVFSLLFCLSFCLLAQSASGEKSEQRINGHEYVDLGLSVKWATCNIGASRPEEYGYYFAWGAVVGSSLSWSGRGFSTSSHYELSNNNLTPEFDAAHVNWGDKWRMPTEAEWDELLWDCTWTWWTTLNGVKGCNVTSRKPGYEGMSIFLPAAGNGRQRLTSAGPQCCYWSSTAHTSDDDDDSIFALILFVDEDGKGISDESPREWTPVRPVSEY